MTDRNRECKVQVQRPSRACLHVRAHARTLHPHSRHAKPSPVVISTTRRKEVMAMTANSGRHVPRAGTLGGSNRMLSARDVAAMLAVPERTVRDKWREWGLPAYRIGKHLRWRERDVHAWIERQAA